MGLLNPHLTSIGPEGLSIAGDVTAEDLSLAVTDEMVRGPISVALTLTETEGTFHATGVLAGTIIRDCVRCLKSYEDPFDLGISAQYAREGRSTPKPKSAGAGKNRASSETEEQPDREDETYRFQGDQLDLAPMLREQIILAAPMHPLCRDTCLGLCARCGQDLNIKRCSCSTELAYTAFRVVRPNKKVSGEKADS